MDNFESHILIKIESCTLNFVRFEFQQYIRTDLNLKAQFLQIVNIFARLTLTFTRHKNVRIFHAKTLFQEKPLAIFLRTKCLSNANHGEVSSPYFFGLFSLLSSTCMREHIKQKRKKSPLTNEAREGIFWINCFCCSSPFGSVQKCAYSAVYQNSPFKVVNISIMVTIFNFDYF